MSPDGQIIKLPEFESNVFGLDLTVVVGVEETFQPNLGIAHPEYLFVEVFHTLGNRHYPEITHPELVLPFVEPGSRLLNGVRNNLLFVTMSANLHPSKVTLDENLKEDAHLGANVVVWARNDSGKEVQIVEVLVAPRVLPRM